MEKKPIFKPVFMLDLDETLINSMTTDEFKSISNSKKVKKFKKHNMDDYYIVFHRPHLQEFLDYIFEHYTVSIWTAASQDYAIFIIDKILRGKKKKNRPIDWVFFNYHCKTASRRTGGTKNLCMLWDAYKLDGYSPENVIILDDNEQVLGTNKGSVIVAKAFEFTDENSHEDDFLKRLTALLKEHNHLRDCSVSESVKSINASLHSTSLSE